ncbi:hypothetical protein LINPERHAP1_LOCUS12765 [Linum perenne]
MASGSQSWALVVGTDDTDLRWKVVHDGNGKKDNPVIPETQDASPVAVEEVDVAEQEIQLNGNDSARLEEEIQQIESEGTDRPQKSPEGIGVSDLVDVNSEDKFFALKGAEMVANTTPEKVKGSNSGFMETGSLG